MLRVYHSNRLDLLEEIMAFIIEQQPLPDPFVPEVVLVQSSGMAQWLQMTLAQKFGIAANMAFPLPARFIWDMFVAVLPNIPDESAFTKAGMTWKLMSLLPEMVGQPEFAQLRHYLGDDSEQRKLFQLASRVADLYDQYLVYRPEWLTAWEAGQRVPDIGEAQDWQAPLWCALVACTNELGLPGWHRAGLYRRFIDTLEQASVPPAGLPARVFICGISALPPVYLQALEALGKHIDIHLLFTNPCRYYWGDIKDQAWLARLATRQRRKIRSDQTSPLFKSAENLSVLFDEHGEQAIANPLLASWGKLGRDYTWLLSELQQFEELDVFVDIERDSLLHRVQYDMLELRNSMEEGLTAESFEHSAHKQLLDPQDHSLMLHICHSPQREVEVLHDHLLALLAEDPELTPRDIIVMVADIDSYSPFIQAVFGSASGDRWIPFAISDRSASQIHPAIQAFIALIGLPDSRFTSGEVMALLEVPTLAARFAIDEDGLRYLRQWVNESGVRWGLDNENVLSLGLPATGQHTWRFGLMRMLLGYAMDSQEGEWRDVLPYDESSGLIAALAGQLACFMERLNHWRHILAQPRSPQEWLPLCHQLLGDFFLPDEDAEPVLTLIEQQWQRVLDEAVDAHYQQPVPLSLVRDSISGRLEQERISQRFLAGPVNVCTLMPMRSIPFRVVCLLGMNDGIYPRTLAPLGFDLMSESPRRGDRSRRDDDRYLFLEALISAREKLYISYIGRAIQDNTPRYPSVLVEELMDYVAQSHYLPGDDTLNVDDSARRVREHLSHNYPRTPFDALNFIPHSQHQSFAREWLPAARQEGEPLPAFMQALPALPCDEISLEQLQRFWRHPVKAFFQMRLKVSFNQDDTDIPDNEPFALDSLDRFQVDQRLLNGLVAGENPEILFRRFKAAGALPYGPFGEIFWSSRQAEMQPLAETILAQRKPDCAQEVSLELAGVRLSGWLQHVQDDGLLRWRPSVLTVSHGLQLWLEHLVWCAGGGTGTSRLYGRQDSCWEFESLPKDMAQHYLAQLIEGYKEGMASPLILLPHSGGAWIKACYNPENNAILWDEETQQKARYKLLQAWEGNQMVDGEGADIWLQRLWRTLEPEYYQAILREAERFLLPLFRFNRA